MNIDSKIELSGASVDVLHALFFRGPLESGDLPSKSGAYSLIELGLAAKSKIAANRNSDKQFTYLTPTGQAYAIKFLVDTDFGKQKLSADRTITVVINVDASPAIEQLKAAQQALETIFKNTLQAEKRPGGILHGS
ncbi:hypothetical protein [Pantoea ananatis]|uniref:hypothetical protein n=1 Tax=Pantoea ananas TaxID=553 RepID=UPI00301873EF